jgi:hypothetical protein
MRHSEKIACWFCDYGGLFFTIVFIVFLAFILRYQFISDNSASISSLATLHPENLSTSDATHIVELTPMGPVMTPTKIPSKPDYIIAFIPVVWTATMDEFFMYSMEHFTAFIEATNMDDYFNVSIAFIEENMDEVSLSSDILVVDVVEFGLTRLPADRYVGLTNGDIALGGDSWVSGWTFGLDYLGVVVETSASYITTHELGHTYGLCDTYSYNYWLEQDAIIPGGCPNRFPTECDISEDICLPGPNTNGEYLVMGVAVPGYRQYFTPEEIQALEKKFIEIGGGYK